MSLRRLCLPALLAVHLGVCQAAPPRSVTLRVAGQPVTAELADDERSRERGLMGRFSLPDNQGMLFVFPRVQTMSFWMKNTAVPLSIAFISSDGRILNIEEMAPHDETIHVSKGAGLYALEMRRGWFRAHRVGPGDRVSGLRRLAPAKD